MILKDIKGLFVYPGQIHGLAVVPAIHTPAIYPTPRSAAFALVVEDRELDQHAGGGYFMGETRYVLAWFVQEGDAHKALARLQERYRLSAAECAVIFEGAL